MHRKRKQGLTVNVPETKLELIRCSCRKSGVGVEVFGLNQRSVGQLFNCTGRNSTIGGWTGGWAVGGEVRKSVAPMGPQAPHIPPGVTAAPGCGLQAWSRLLTWGLVTEL